MPAQTVLRNVIEFFERIGIYDVVLPFLLVFTIAFAILEKSKILGTEKIKGEVFPKKNLNAMAAFVIAFLVVASSKLVEIITQVSSQVIVLVLLGVFFMLLVGTFYKPTKEGEPIGLEEGWLKWSFTVIMFVGILAIFMNAMGWLQALLNYLRLFWSSTVVASIVLILVIILFVWYITKSEEKTPSGGGTP